MVLLGADETDSPAVDPARFRGPDERFPGTWRPGDEHQRLLLHRARAKVRRALEDYLAPEAA